MARGKIDSFTDQVHPFTIPCGYCRSSQALELEFPSAVEQPQKLRAKFLEHKRSSILYLATMQTLSILESVALPDGRTIPILVAKPD
jgi:hypothetical protein